MEFLFFIMESAVDRTIVNAPWFSDQFVAMMASPMPISALQNAETFISLTKECALRMTDANAAEMLFLSVVLIKSLSEMLVWLTAAELKLLIKGLAELNENLKLALATMFSTQYAEMMDRVTKMNARLVAPMCRLLTEVIANPSKSRVSALIFTSPYAGKTIAPIPTHAVPSVKELKISWKVNASRGFLVLVVTTLRLQFAALIHSLT